MLASTTAAVAANTLNKGDVLATARVAGIQAAKRASSLLPMAHPVLVGNVYVNFTIGDTYIDLEAGVDTILVLSGVARAEDVSLFPFQPSRIVDSVADLIDEL